ncbi:MAG TPA: hypothetical protein VMD30_01730 [Tepidisphaeraceae bacterium]|nr:hypothetical protein [Tepidisphaeraceae bacterium]
MALVTPIPLVRGEDCIDKQSDANFGPRVNATEKDRVDNAILFVDWQRLNGEYARQFGVEAPNWPSSAAKG